MPGQARCSIAHRPLPVLSFIENAGEDAPAGTSGLLFNFNLEFSAPGEYRLGFMDFDEVNRTYYQDGSQAVYLWGDMSNNNAYNTVVVTP